MKQIKVGSHMVGEGCPAYIIAEMSANHAGDIERAKEIIRKAKECGADCVKIQTYTPDTITIDCDNPYFHIDNGTWEGENLYSLYGKAYTPWEWQGDLKAEADRVGIDFFSTPFDRTSVDFLEGIGMTFYKIASFELVDIPLIRYVAAKKKPMILSTGMASLEEIQEAVDTIRGAGNEQFILLRCASAYPAISDEMNLATMLDMSERFGVPTGLSDHSMGSLAAVTAVAMGASVIEKHFCLGRDIENPDSSFSMEPEEFAAMVRDIRQAEKAKGTVRYGVEEQEKENRVFRKSIFVVRDIAAGEELTEENIRVIRPGYGMHPREYDHVLGKKCAEPLKRGEPLKASAIEDFLRFEPAGEEQKELLFDWANDEETRRQSFSTTQISWEEHERWFEKSMTSSDRKLYICCHGETPIGVFRLDRVLEGALVFRGAGASEKCPGAGWEISYHIAPDMRRRGYGEAMVAQGEHFVRRNLPDAGNLTARVKPENEASRRIFEKLGYIAEQEPDCVRFWKAL